MLAPATCPCFWGEVSGAVLRWAESLPPFCWAQTLWLAGPYYAGRPLLRLAATLNGSSDLLPCQRPATFCAGHMISFCLALTLRWAESSPRLRWAQTL